LSLLAIFVQQTVYAGPLHHQKNADFDYYVFAQEWPHAMCHVANVHQPGSCLVPKNVDGWTIHGLWPSSFDRPQGPSNCDKGRPFQEAKIEGIKGKMEIQWANMVPSTSDASFWSHEWSKHGTCAVEPSVDKGELKYFSEALRLNTQHAIGKYLQSSGIEPSQDATIKLSDIERAIEKVTSSKFETHCLHLNNDGKHTWFLVDVRICLDKDLKCIDCPGSRDHQRRSRASDFGFLELRSKQQINPKEREQHSRQLPTPESCPQNQPLHYVPAAF